jgi:hypothetical protein
LGKGKLKNGKLKNAANALSKLNFWICRFGLAAVEQAITVASFKTAETIQN